MSFRVTRSAKAAWQGNVEEGGGRIALGSGAFDGPYSLRSRERDGERTTNPEELLGAAEAGCYTMSLANVLGEAGHPAGDIRTTARVTLAQVDGSFTITRIDLETVAEVPGLDAERFGELAQQAKDCTVSRVLTGTEITLAASLGGA